jgi:hypothetical protein
MRVPGNDKLRGPSASVVLTLWLSIIAADGLAAPDPFTICHQERVVHPFKAPVIAPSLGEPPEDPLLLFSVLCAVWVASYVAFNGDVIRDLGAQFLALAEKQRATFPLMKGIHLMGMSLLFMGDIPEGRGHLDQAIAL